ncbi:unnamed protein product [Adineta steineri]|uniref:Uncharacterized protein n=1 Tax=Adineta steineri TaxID=433720 RepID=A0A818HMA3_9BILA|nr:unnamed protein product [Adineta steineri]
MTIVKAITGFLIVIVVVCNGQFLTPDQLREQHDLGYGARTHYEMSGSRRTDMFGRVNPDYLLRGFFPFWSIVLVAFALLFLTISVIGLIGYLLGCRRPTPEELYANEFEQLTPDDEFLLGGGGVTNVDETKTSTNGYFNNNTDRQNYHYNSSPSAERTRIGQSDEDMV